MLDVDRGAAGDPPADSVTDAPADTSAGNLAGTAQDHRVVAESRFHSGEDDCGLAAARALGDSVLMARIVDRWGVDLAHGPHGPLLFEIASGLPVELATSLPGLAFRLEDIGRLPLGTTPVRLPRSAEEAATEFALHGDLRLRQALLPLATRRRRGRFREAMAVVEAAQPLAEACVYPWYGGRSQILPYWYLQAGVTALVAGEPTVSAQFLRNAWTHRARTPYPFVPRAIAGRLALAAALDGDHGAAATWLARAELEHREPDLWVDLLAQSNLTAARAATAIDALDPEAGAHLRSTFHPAQPNEQWPVQLWIHVRHALSIGDTAQARRYLDETVAARSEAMTRSGLAARIVPLVRADLHLALGQATQALAEIDGAPDLGGAGQVLRARTLLLAGSPESATAAAEQVVQDGTTSTAATTEALLVAAAGLVATGDRPAAVSAARRACARVQEHGSLRSLTTIPRTSLDQLAPDVPGLVPLLATLDQRGIGDLYPATVALVSVTGRERDLLRDLDSGLSLTAIAKANFVSVNTTRTHLASLRRKLDARSRAEVVARARLLGLLDPAD